MIGRRSGTRSDRQVTDLALNDESLTRRRADRRAPRMLDPKVRPLYLARVLAGVTAQDGSVHD
jgi:hypothetical protein